MKLYITIDTEPDCDPKWNRPFPYSFTSVTTGIPEILRPIWNKFNIDPIYFISPEILESKECIEVLKREQEKGAIIGTHLHSEYIEPKKDIPNSKPSYEFPCFAHDTETEFQKIKNLTDKIQSKFGFKPEWYRAARFGADTDTIKSLAKLGYKFDSSVTPNIDWRKSGGPDHTNAPEQPYWISEKNIYLSVNEEDSSGVMELPVTISGKRGGIFKNILPETWHFYRWLRPSHMTVGEQKKLLDDFCKTYTDPVFVMMFHSMEVMINKSPFVRNRFMQKHFISRLISTIEYYKNLEEARS